MRWEVAHGLAAVERCAAEWDELARAGSGSPTSDATWMGRFWGAFADADRALAVHTLREDGRLLAALALRKRPGPIGAWVSVANAHTPHWAFAIDEERPELPRAVLDHLLEDAEVVDLSQLLAGGYAAGALLRAARETGRPAALETLTQEVWLDLRGSWETFKLRIPAKMRRETGRKLRQLEQKGRLEFEVIRGGERLRDLLGECYELETLGWKGAHGSPIKNDPRTLRFYTELAESEAGAGRFALYLLRLDGRLVAFEYSLRAEGRIDLLKPSYDPELSKFSPGNVLRYKVLQFEVEAGEVDSYHLGRASDWKRLWVSEADDLCRLRVYRRSLRARLAHATGPGLRGVLRRSRLMRELVTRARSLRGRRGS